MIKREWYLFIFILLFVLSLAFSISITMDVFKVGSLNVNGARETQKRALVFEMAKMKHIDVLFLQETHSDAGIEADWSREWEGEVILSHNTTLSGGVGYLFSRGFTPTSLEVRHVVEGRCLLVRAHFEHFNVVFINIYAPNNGTERKHFFEKLNDILNSCDQEDYLFIGGDFNCTENEILDRNHAEPHPVSQHTLRQLVSLMTWWTCGEGCMQAADNTHGPTLEKTESLWPDLIVFMSLSTE